MTSTANRNGKTASRSPCHYFQEAAMDLKRASTRGATLLVACLAFIAAYHLLPADATAQSSGRLASDRLVSNWPQWRGPEGLGISAEKGLPVEWGEAKNIQWKTPIEGRGHSSPIIWGKKIFLTTSIEGPVVDGAKAVKHIRSGQVYVHPDSVGGDHSYTLRVLCLDRDTGKILWDRAAYQGTVYDDRHRKNTYASGTPATDGRLVYAFFEAEGIYCYDFNGKLIWKKSLGKIANGNGARHVSGALRRIGDPAMRSGRRRARVFHCRAR
jgi:hypothetical protein